MNNGYEVKPVKYASAFSDVIGYSSCAGNIPDNTQTKLVNWITRSFNSKDIKFADATGSCLCLCNSKIAMNAIGGLISEAPTGKVKEILISYHDETTPNR